MPAQIHIFSRKVVLCALHYCSTETKKTNNHQSHASSRQTASGTINRGENTSEALLARRLISFLWRFAKGRDIPTCTFLFSSLSLLGDMCFLNKAKVEIQRNPNTSHRVEMGSSSSVQSAGEHHHRQRQRRLQEKQHGPGKKGQQRCATYKEGGSPVDIAQDPHHNLHPDAELQDAPELPGLQQRQTDADRYRAHPSSSPPVVLPMVGSAQTPPGRSIAPKEAIPTGSGSASKLLTPQHRSLQQQRPQPISPAGGVSSLSFSSYSFSSDSMSMSNSTPLYPDSLNTSTNTAPPLGQAEARLWNDTASTYRARRAEHRKRALLEAKQHSGNPKAFAGNCPSGVVLDEMEEEQVFVVLPVSRPATLPSLSHPQQLEDGSGVPPSPSPTLIRTFPPDRLPRNHKHLAETLQAQALSEMAEMGFQLPEGKRSLDQCTMRQLFVWE